MSNRFQLTFLPSGIAVRSTSTLAMAKTSAEADMLTRNSINVASAPSIDKVQCTSDGWQLQLQLNGIVRDHQSPTLHSALGSSGTHGTESTNHEVREELVLALALVGDIFSKVGDLGALGLALEGAREGRGRRSGGSQSGGAEGAGDGDSGPGCRAQAETGSGRERRHRERGGTRLWRWRKVRQREGLRSFPCLYRLMMLCRKFWAKNAA